MRESNSHIAQLKALIDEALGSELWERTRDNITFLHHQNIGKIGHRSTERLVSPAESANKLADRCSMMLYPYRIEDLYSIFKNDSGERGETAARKILSVIGKREDVIDILCWLLALDLIDKLGEEKDESEPTFEDVFVKYDAAAIKAYIREALDNPKNHGHKGKFVYVRAVCDALLGDEPLPWKVFHKTFPDYPAEAVKQYNKCVRQTFSYDKREYRKLLTEVFEKFTTLDDNNILIEVNGVISSL